MNDKMESSIWKYKQLDVYNHKKGQSFDKYKSKGKDKKYVTFLFITLSFLF